MHSFRDLFHYPKNLNYLNSGSVALSPKSVIEKMAQEKALYELNPTDGLFSAWKKMWSTQKNLAQFFDADAKNIFLRTNVTYVMNDFIMALKLPANSEILISDLEYGAVVKICEYKAELEGHSLRVFSLHDKNQDPSTLSEEEILDRVQSALTPKTKLVMLSHVMTGSGLKIPAEKIGALLHSRGVFFACDGAHGAGSTDLDFSNTQIDFYGTNLHKWLMGPKGTGFGHVLPRMREHLQPKWAGWTTGTLFSHFAVFGEADPWTARWMICSTHNFSDFYGIDTTLDFWREHPSSVIFARQKELADFCGHHVSEKTGWKNLSAFPENLRGPLVAFELPEKLAAREFELMFFLQREHQIVISMTIIQGSWCLRMAPHIYNTKSEIEQAAEIFCRVPGS